MKCYTTKHELRLVGKTWEIRHQMKQILKDEARTNTLTLKQYLSKYHAHSEGITTHAQQHYKHLRKNLHPHVIPFPLS